MGYPARCEVDWGGIWQECGKGLPGPAWHSLPITSHPHPKTRAEPAGLLELEHSLTPDLAEAG